jgi:hypothetical protein
VYPHVQEPLKDNLNEVDIEELDMIEITPILHNIMVYGSWGIIVGLLIGVFL